MPETARLYILMRTDMDYSMSPGRKMAQASHAANAAHSVITKENRGSYLPFADWLTEANGFGTAVVLGAKLADIETVRQVQDLYKNNRNVDFACGIVHDPVYSIADGEVSHEIAVDTCAWLFGYPSSIVVKTLTSHLELHP